MRVLIEQAAIARRSPILAELAPIRRGEPRQADHHFVNALIVDRIETQPAVKPSRTQVGLVHGEPDRLAGAMGLVDQVGDDGRSDPGAPRFRTKDDVDEVKMLAGLVEIESPYPPSALLDDQPLAVGKHGPEMAVLRPMLLVQESVQRLLRPVQAGELRGSGRSIKRSDERLVRLRLRAIGDPKPGGGAPDGRHLS